jgi:glycosyltransferase involved in cell wall biosynthesis
MRIAVDATCWQNSRGYGRHARGLLSALVRIDRANRYVFILDSEDYGALPEEIEKRIVRNTAPTVRAASAHGHRSAADLWRISRVMSEHEFDLLLFPTIYSFVPVISRAKKIVMIHDVIAEKFSSLTLPRTTARLFWRIKVALGLWQADTVVTVSEFSRKCILEHFRLPSERVSVVGEGCDPIFRALPNPQPTQRLQTLGIVKGGRYIVYLGGFSPHKNLESLVAVFSKLSSEFPDVRLVMVGEHEKEVFHSYFGTVRRHVDDCGVSGRVIFTGYLPDSDLVVLLNLCTVSVLPSFMEGFGLPAVEAAACGCPVIATKESPLPALLGNGALYVDPKQSDQLQLALTRILASESLRRHMRDAGVAAASRLTWDTAARQLLSLMEQMFGQKEWACPKLTHQSASSKSSERSDGYW